MYTPLNLIYLPWGHLPRKETKFVDIQSNYFFCQLQNKVSSGST